MLFISFQFHRSLVAYCLLQLQLLAADAAAPLYWVGSSLLDTLHGLPPDAASQTSDGTLRSILQLAVETSENQLPEFVRRTRWTPENDGVCQPHEVSHIGGPLQEHWKQLLKTFATKVVERSFLEAGWPRPPSPTDGVSKEPSQWHLRSARLVNEVLTTTAEKPEVLIEPAAWMTGGLAVEVILLLPDPKDSSSSKTRLFKVEILRRASTPVREMVQVGESDILLVRGSEEFRILPPSPDDVDGDGKDEKQQQGGMGRRFLLLEWWLHPQDSTLSEQPEGILNLLQKAVDSDPDSAALRLHLARSLLHSNEPSKAQEQLSVARRFDPKWDLALFEAAWAHIFLDEKEEGLKLVQQAIGLNPSSPQLHIGLSSMLSSVAGDHQAAVTALRKAVKLDPLNVELKFDLISLLGQPKSKEVKALLKGCIKGAPGNPHVLHRAGLLFVERDDLRRAERALLKSLELGPQGGARFDLGVLYHSNGMPKKAMQQYRQAMSAHPKDPRPVVNLAKLMGEVNEPDLARLLIERALTIDPKDSKALVQLAVFQEQDKDYVTATKTLRQAAAQEQQQLQKQAPEISVALARVLAASRKAPFGSKGFQERIDLLLNATAAEENPKATVLLGDARQEEGKMKEAAKLYKAAAALDPSYQEPIRRLKALVAAGHLDENELPEDSFEDDEEDVQVLEDEDDEALEDDDPRMARTAMGDASEEDEDDEESALTDGDLVFEDDGTEEEDEEDEEEEDEEEDEFGLDEGDDDDKGRKETANSEDDEDDEEEDEERDDEQNEGDDEDVEEEEFRIESDTEPLRSSHRNADELGDLGDDEEGEDLGNMYGSLEESFQSQFKYGDDVGDEAPPQAEQEHRQASSKQKVQRRQKKEEEL